MKKPELRIGEKLVDVEQDLVDDFDGLRGGILELDELG